MCRSWPPAFAGTIRRLELSGRSPSFWSHSVIAASRTLSSRLQAHQLDTFDDGFAESLSWLFYELVRHRGDDASGDHRASKEVCNCQIRIGVLPKRHQVALDEVDNPELKKINAKADLADILNNRIHDG